jgi:hypothetical protein
VTFDFFDTPGYEMWHEAGVSLHATVREAFLPAARQALFDGETRAALAQRRRAFVAHYMRLDGHATERVVNLLVAGNDATR